MASPREVLLWSLRAMFKSASLVHTDFVKSKAPTKAECSPLGDVPPDRMTFELFTSLHTLNYIRQKGRSGSLLSTVLAGSSKLVYF